MTRDVSGRGVSGRWYRLDHLRQGLSHYLSHLTGRWYWDSDCDVPLTVRPRIKGADVILIVVGHISIISASGRVHVRQHLSGDGSGEGQCTPVITTSPPVVAFAMPPLRFQIPLLFASPHGLDAGGLDLAQSFRIGGSSCPFR